MEKNPDEVVEIQGTVKEENVDNFDRVTDRGTKRSTRKRRKERPSEK